MTVLIGVKPPGVERFKLALGADVRVVENMRALSRDLADHPDELLVVVGPEADLSIATEVADLNRDTRPALGVVLLRQRLEVAALAAAIRSGVREVVQSEDSAELAAACRRSREVSLRVLNQQTEEGSRSMGKVVVVFSAKGGCGKTTVATNLAEALQISTGEQVCLIDFDLQFGDVGVALRVDPAKTISDAIGMGTELDEEGVLSLGIEYKPGMTVVLAPLNPADVEHISGDMAGQVIRVMREKFSYVVVDSPPAFTDVVLRSFDAATDIVLLTTLDLPAVKNLKVTLDTLKALSILKDRWQVVVNRSDANLGMSISDVERLLGVEVAVAIPHSQEVPVSINSGATLVSLKPGHPVSEAIFELASRIIEGPSLKRIAKAKRWSVFRRNS